VLRALRCDRRLDDPDGIGGYRGWANRLAEQISRAQGSLLYANLAIRGNSTRQIRDEQLDRALAMNPDLSSVFCGTNDLLRRKFDADAVGRDIEFMQRSLIGAGATVVTFTMPDLSSVMPLARCVAPRLHALNDAMRAVAAETGTILVDLADEPMAVDRRFWSDDRLHANAAGHERIAIALAVALGFPPPSEEWNQPLPAEPRPTVGRRLAGELSWGGKHLAPWVGRRLLGRSSGDDRKPKRPELQAV
jgi:lysophospholipase L1-like esterase